jgi:predicted NBD/HSP70 family sugar kinase
VVSVSVSRKSLQLEGIRERSRSLVYDCLLDQHGEKLSRNDISRLTGLSHPTISTVLQEFAQLGLVDEVGQSTARGGRPAQLVRFNAVASCVISVDLSGASYCAALLDLTGAILDRVSGPRRQADSTAELFRWLDEVVATYARDYKVGMIALALPGVVEPAAGTVHFAPALGWHDYPLAAVLKERLGYEVLLENDVNALAAGELHSGQSFECANAIFMSITSGIGIGVVINGQIYRGSNSAAGEIGYGTLAHVAGQPNPTFGQPGPLEAHLQQLSSVFVGEAGISLDSAAAREAFGRFSADLAVILQNAICLLNPDRLVISWPDDPEGLLAGSLRRLMNTPMPIEVVAAASGRDGTLLGAARLALDALEEDFCTLGAAEPAGG